MTKYLARACPRCNGYLGVVLRPPERNTGLQAIRGHCFKCHHQLTWKLLRGKALFPVALEEKSFRDGEPAANAGRVLTKNE
jgi:hypothetical protein